MTSLLLELLTLPVMGVLLLLAGRGLRRCAPSWIGGVFIAMGLTGILIGLVALFVVACVFTGNQELAEKILDDMPLLLVLVAGIISFVWSGLGLLCPVALIFLARHIRETKEQLEIYEERV